MKRKKLEVDVAGNGVTECSSLIFDERMRQSAKGFNSAHDDAHTDGSILRCAMDILVSVAVDENGEIPDSPEWVMNQVEHTIRKYRNAPMRMLVIAAAMIGAEIERLQRKALSETKSPSRRKIGRKR